MLSRIILLFPVWALLCSGIAFYTPDLFTGLKGWITSLLMLIMLSMGLTLQFKDFTSVANKKAAVGIGIALQYTVMPLAALLVSLVLGLSAELTIGMILVGSVSGGTASNVMAYLGKGDVALSVSMTAISTLLGVVMTPLLASLLASTTVDVPVWPMLVSLFQIVVAPIAVGLIANLFFHKQIRVIEPILPLISMATIILVIAIIVALNADKLPTIGPIVLLAVMLHNGIGLIAGFWVPRLLGFDHKTCRTVAFEVALQNSGLASALAFKFFTPVAAVPGTVFSLWHNLSGSALAGYWTKVADEELQAAPTAAE